MNSSLSFTHSRTTHYSHAIKLVQLNLVTHAFKLQLHHSIIQTFTTNLQDNWMNSTTSSNLPTSSTPNTTPIESQSAFAESLVASTITTNHQNLQTKNMPIVDVAHATTTNAPVNTTLKDLLNAKKSPSGKFGSQTFKVWEHFTKLPREDKS
ncbi:hypothetical protein REPUB_Repub07fG0203800 [Reevesia pubescens]